MDKRKNKNVLKRKGFVVTDITNNNISDCQSSNQKSTNRVNNRVNALKKNGFEVKDIDNNYNCVPYKKLDEQINDRNVISEEVNNNIENNCNDINETIEDITDCEVIDSEDNNTDIKCELISEECNQLDIKAKNSLNNLFENKTLLSDSRLHTILGFEMRTEKQKKIIAENNLIVDYSVLRKDEYKIIERNWNKFCDDYNLDNEFKVLLLGIFHNTNRYTKQDKRQIRQFIKSTNFYLRIGKDLPYRRINILVYAIKRRFCPIRKFKDITQDDKIIMKNLYFNNKIKSWNLIAEKLNCSSICVRLEINQNYNENGELYDKGRWSSAEERILLDGMKAYLNTNDLSKHVFDKNIKYVELSKNLTINRPAHDIRMHWKDCLRWKVAYFNQLEDNWSKSDAIKLIYCLFRLNYSNESDIDWDLIKDKFSKITSFNNLMKNWRIIKSSVPDFDSKTYKQIVEYLYDNYLPQNVRTDEDLKALEEFYNN